jgi:hypothetical protein
MSYIDCWNHLYIGSLGKDGLPIYMTLEDIDGDEFKATEGSIVLGGGSGEHPALIIENLDFCMASFLDTWVNEYKAHIPQETQDAITIYVEWVFEDADFYRDELDFHNWSTDNHYHFVKQLKTLEPNDVTMGTENLIIESIGEYLIFTDYADHIGIDLSKVSTIYNNVVCNYSNHKLDKTVISGMKVISSANK